MWKQTSCTGLILLAFAECSHAASEKMGSFAARTAVAARNTRDLLLSEFEKIRPTIGKISLSSIDVQIDENDWMVDTVRSQLSNGKYAIRIPIGFILAADYMDRALAESMIIGERDGENIAISELIPYVSVVRSGLERSTYSQIENRRSEPIQYFCEYMGKSQSFCFNLRSTRQYQNYYNLIKVSSFAYVLGHELGHIAYNDFKKSGYSTSNAELRADEYGLRLALAAGYNPIAAMGTFLYFASIHVPSNNSPQPECRLLAALRVADDGFSSDAGFQEYLQKRGTRSKVTALQQQIRQLARLQNNC